MKRLIICLSMILLVTLTTSTTNAQVIRADKVEALKKVIEASDMDSSKWLLIHTDTLREIHKDAEGYRLALEKLNTAQEKHIEDIFEQNALNKEKYQLQKNLYDLRVTNHSLRFPPWYQSSLMWGTVGAAVGVTAGMLFGSSSGGN